jgi:hypothetical protein
MHIAPVDGLDQVLDRVMRGVHEHILSRLLPE